MLSFQKSILLSLALLMACATQSALAFSSPRIPTAQRPDTSALVEQALKTTATYGVTSPEAKVAWDIVEEMDASDNRYVRM
jgi:hypothetical protein